MKKKVTTLEAQIIFLSVFIVISVLLISGLSFYTILYHSVEESVQTKALQVTQLLAKLPIVTETLKEKQFTSDLQTIYEQYLAETDEKVFVVLIDQEGIRYTHPEKELIGYKITGDDEGRAIKGETYVSNAVGISGATLRTYVPVIDPETNEQIGVLSLGMLRENLAKYVNKYIFSIFKWLGIALLIGIITSLLLARKIKKALYGYEPDEIARLFSEREAILESLNEGIIAIDQEKRITLVNQSAKTLLQLPDNLIGSKITESLTEINLLEIMTSRPGESVEMHVNHVTILIWYYPIIRSQNRIGTIFSFRDITEVRNLAEKLTGVQQYIDGLRAKSHEFMNKLQTIAGLIELKKYNEVKEYISATTAKQQDLLHFLSRNIKEPKLSGLLLGKIQLAEELHIEITFTPGSRFNGSVAAHMIDSLVLIIGNLVQNAIDELKNKRNGEIQLTILDNKKQLIIIVEDNGAGLTEAEKKLIFQKGFSTKGTANGYGLYLVKHHVEKILEGRIDVDSTVGEGTSFLVEIPKWRGERLENKNANS